MVTLLMNFLMVVGVAFMLLSLAAIAVQLFRAVRAFRAGYAEEPQLNLL